MRQICEVCSKEGCTISIIADSSKEAMYSRARQILEQQNSPMHLDTTFNVKHSEVWKQDTKESVVRGNTPFQVYVVAGGRVLSSIVTTAGVKSAYISVKRQMGLKTNPFMIIYSTNQKPIKMKKSSKACAIDIVKRQDSQTMQKVLVTASEKVRSFPVLGQYAEDIMLLFALIQDYVQGRYTKIPIGVIVAIIAVVIYFAFPIDLIPDVIPVAGVVDDAGVLVWALNTFHKDIEEYKQWRGNN